MSYLQDFQTQIAARDFEKFMQLWEEYCASDTLEPEEVVTLLQSVKNSDLAKQFGPIVETALPLLDLLPTPEGKYEVLRHLIDLQTTQSPKLAEVTLQALQGKYGQDPTFMDRLRMVGLRTKENFQGAISRFDLLHHLEVGNFVLHTGGWGVGEIMEVSSVREIVAVEFEKVGGRKSIPFATAFKSLAPLPHAHFLARRFGDADGLEKEAKEDPVKMIKMMLKDLGPLTAPEVKDALEELVIPEAEWTKWWSNTRSRLKKDTLIDSPETLKEPFRLRKVELLHEAQLETDLHQAKTTDEILEICYTFMREYPGKLKDPVVHACLKTALEGLNALSDGQKWEKVLALGTLGVAGDTNTQITTSRDLTKLLEEIRVMAYRKQALVAIRQHRPDWIVQLVKLLTSVEQSPLRDYMLKELNQGEARQSLLTDLKELLLHPENRDDLFLWFFQKALDHPASEVPYTDKEGYGKLFESFLVLLNRLEKIHAKRDIVKKMYMQLIHKRYELIRQFFEGTSLETIKEYLLLASKCHTFSDSDIMILRSLAEVVHPSLKEGKETRRPHNEVIWTTEEGFLATQKRIQEIGTTEMVDNAREIEAARALGDLRENSEFKAAQERRARLQTELKNLSHQLQKSRVLTQDDLKKEEVGVGSVVDLVDLKGQKVRYTILGPLDADADRNILSFQSKLAQLMEGLHVGETFQFKEEEYKIVALGGTLKA